MAKTKRFLSRTGRKHSNLEKAMHLYIFSLHIFLLSVFSSGLLCAALTRPCLFWTSFSNDIWVRSRNCGCLVTWFCYQLIAKPGNKTATVSWPDPYIPSNIVVSMMLCCSRIRPGLWPDSSCVLAAGDQWSLQGGVCSGWLWRKHSLRVSV